MRTRQEIKNGFIVDLLETKCGGIAGVFERGVSGVTEMHDARSTAPEQARTRGRSPLGRWRWCRAIVKMSRNPAAAIAAAALVVATLCCRPSTAFFSSCHVLRASRPRNTFPADAAALGILLPQQITESRRRSWSPSFGGDGFIWAQLESAWTSTSKFMFSDRPRRAGGLLLMMSLDDGEGESNALLMRMDFEHAEVEELREWIRRWGSSPL